MGSGALPRPLLRPRVGGEGVAREETDMNVLAPASTAPQHALPLTLNATPVKLDDFQLHKTSMTVASGEQRVTSVVQSDGFLVYTIESECAPEVIPTWSVYVVHDSSGDQTPTKILSYSATELACGSKPECTSISDDGVLALSLGPGGLKMYLLRYDGFNAQSEYLFDYSMAGHCHLMGKWIAQAHEGHCMVTRTVSINDTQDSLWVHSCVTGRSSFQNLLQCPMGLLLDADASSPGNVIALLASCRVHVLTRAEKGEFTRRLVDLNELPNPGTPIRAAIGSRMFVVSTAAREEYGEVLCFNIESGEMTNRRRCKGQATALATDGSRCAFGVSCEEESALYCVYEKRPATFTLSYDLGRMEWPRRGVSLDSESFVCAVTYEDDMEEGYNVSVIEYCSVEMSGRGPWEEE
jgi:hypothetical protein